MLLAVPPIQAAAAPQGVAEYLFLLAVMLAAAKIAGELAERIGQPAVLGELLAGVALGASILGVVDPADPLIHLLAQFGVIILLFEIGLETDLRRLLRVGPASSIVAIVGVVLPFGLGYAALVGLGFPALPAVVAGAALTATSVGITARVLSDLGRLHEPESQIVLGAAVIDDVIGLIILAVVAKAVAGAHLTLSGVAMTTALAFGFLAAVLAVGTVAGPPLFRLLARLSREETLATMGLALGFLVAYLADISGSALIVGAFAAGLVVERTPQAPVVGRGIVALGQFFVPIFFVAVGAAVDVRSFLDPGVLTVGAALIAVAIVGKVAAGYAPIWSTAKKSVIGVGMMPRGEVGLIFAQMGLTAGVLSAGLFSALMLMVMVTTFLAPPLLKILFPPLGEGLPPPPEGVAKITTEA